MTAAIFIECLHYMPDNILQSPLILASLCDVVSSHSADGEMGAQKAELSQRYTAT